MNDTITTADGRTVPPPTEADFLVALDIEYAEWANPSLDVPSIIRRCYAAESQRDGLREHVKRLRGLLAAMGKRIAEVLAATAPKEPAK